ncbi:hypothetical protein C500_17886 [Natrialba magadii ATCC 43099]|uniref:Uncharacterized protein n=1 Tax=Natrialba magadii (strain ATCC 43099 / DSM 3394 / CCM 3739 / CIP 104546 / IAM 13178 / JCM 8861 / NBRC 102185 / NCIMB 2190 / MS3) TaxID=547559 RepID=L9UM90_NATMM|nr:hypothetical protein [Natrialba magadii]ELY25313.1 hypothetical protein C500_17886 [Natrialba magadii ATCC 43099]
MRPTPSSPPTTVIIVIVVIVVATITTALRTVGRSAQRRDRLEYSFRSRTGSVMRTTKRQQQRS